MVDAAVTEITGGYGVDQVYLAAGGSSNEPVELAAKLSRDRGRVVDIGKCRLDLPWNAYYEKELDVRFSRSYGPGRYDPSYELEGRDYPIGYVRWTERRNIECFLDLAARGRLDVEPLVSHVARVRRRGRDLPEAGRWRAEGRGRPLRATRAGNGSPRRSRLPRSPSACVRPVPRRRWRQAGRCGWRSSAPGTTQRRCCCPTWPSVTTSRCTTSSTTSALSGANAKRKFGFADAGTDLPPCWTTRPSTPCSSRPGTARTPS